MGKLTDIETTFKAVEDIGKSGADLAMLTSKLIVSMENVISLYELGMSSESWVTSFEDYTNAESLQLSQDIYVILKDARTKLAEIGV